MVATEEQWASFQNLFKEHGTQLTYKKGEFIIRPGETLSSVFFIETGLVKAYDITKYGEENLVIIRRPLEVFPLIWAISGDERKIIYEALSRCVLWKMHRDYLVDYMETNPGAYAPLLDMVVEMYRIHAERIFNLEYRSVRERLISFLLTMAHRFGKEAENGVLIDVPLRHQDIASSINASRETTSREIAILERQHLLTNELTSITLRDSERLRSML